MAITYKAGAPEQRTFTILPAGKYPFRVLDANQQRSKAGNDMIELKLDFYDDDGNSSTVWDFLVFTEKSVWKVDHFLKSCGMHPGEGQEIDLNPNEFIGFEGMGELRIGKTDKGVERNEVAAYTWDEGDGF